MKSERVLETKTNELRKGRFQTEEEQTLNRGRADFEQRKSRLQTNRAARGQRESQISD